MGLAGRVLGGVLVSGVAAIGAASVGTPAVREVPPVRSFTVIAAGDILTENRVLANGQAAAGPGERYDFGPLFAPIAPIVAGAGLAICHLEMPLGWPDQAPGAYGRSLVANRLLGPAEMAAGIAATGFDRCSTASNHSYDMDAAGIDSTLGMLDAAGVTHVGTARSPAEAAAGIVPFAVNGVRVAHLSYSTSSNTELPAAWRFAYTPRSNPQPVIDDVAAARAAGAEVVIVSIHIGRERVHTPFPDDRAFVEAIVGAGGVDLVIEHGPHVIQPVEQVTSGGHTSWVFWSVGNLVSGMGEPGDPRYGPAARDGLLAWAEVTVAHNGAATVTPSAVLVCNQQWTRTVWPATARADPATPADVRPQLEACLARAIPIVPDLA